MSYISWKNNLINNKSFLFCDFQLQMPWFAIGTKKSSIFVSGHNFNIKRTFFTNRIK